MRTPTSVNGLGLVRLGLIGIGLLLAPSVVAAAPAPTISMAQPAADTAHATAEDTATQNYILGAADVIEVSVLGRPEFTTRGRIGEDGTIRVPYLGSVAAANKTIGQFGDELAKALDAGGYFSHPIVKVDVVSYASRYVTVLGNVTTPGLVVVDRAYRLSEIVARVGGIKETGADYVIFRPKQGPERRISIEALATGDLNEDPYVSPGDKIYVPLAEVFYVSGQVKTPGAFAIQPNITLRMAISRGGGLTDSGSMKGLTVTRGGKKLKNLDPDSKVMPGDVIEVPERLF